MDEKLFSKLSVIFLAVSFVIYILMFAGVITYSVAALFGFVIAPLLLIASIVLSSMVLKKHNNHLALYSLVISAFILLMFILSLIFGN